MYVPNAQTVVVVEDDAELREKVLLPGLRLFGFDAIGARNALDLYRMLVKDTYSLYVLDVGLPDDDGFEIVRNLRKSSQAGIVMLTGRDSSTDRVRGLTEGADVYLTKPVEVEVVAASLHSLLRRMNIRGEPPNETPEVAVNWRLEADGWRLVTPKGKVIALSLAERIIVSRLVSSPDKPVPREALISDIADVVEEFDPNRLEMIIHRLRKKVLGKSDEELPLTTVRNSGYLLRL